MDASPPIPPPLDSDDEDVYLALSTARTLWNRGERDDALRWLRRAAEKASDADEDARALDLFKAAAELSSKIAASPAVTVAAAPPAPPIQRASTPPPPAYTAARPSVPPPLPTAAKAAPPPLPRAAAPQSAAPAQQPPLQQPSGRRGTRTGGRAPVPPPGVRTAPAVAPQAVQAAPQGVARVPAQAPALRPRIDSPPQQRESAAPASAAVPSAARPPMRPPSTDKMPAVRHDASQPPPSAYVQAVHNQGARSSAMPAPPTVRAPVSAAVPARSAAPAAVSTATPATRTGTPARAASTSGGRRRTVNQKSPFYEDEVTAQRQIPVQPQARALPDLVEGTTGDGDEATAIIQGGLLGNDASAQKQVVQQAVQQAIARAAAAKREEAHTADVMTSAPAAAGLIRTPVAAPQQAAPEAAPRKSAWPATRVAVVKTAAGVQLMPMGQGDQAPAGSAVAVLIPLSEADGAVLAQLFGTSL